MLTVKTTLSPLYIRREPTSGAGGLFDSFKDQIKQAADQSVKNAISQGQQAINQKIGGGTAAGTQVNVTSSGAVPSKEAGNNDKSKDMSTGKKVAIAAVIALALGSIGFYIYKHKNKK